MSVANYDELNILWVGQMDLSPQEKLLRVEMISEFERKINSVFSSQLEHSDKAMLIAGFYTLMLSNSYKEMANSYFSRYVTDLLGRNVKISEYSRKWIETHSEQFAREIQETTNKFMSVGDYENAFATSRIRNISRTEMNALSECATLESFYQQGYKEKMWVSFKDEKTRTSHRYANGQIRGLFEPFDVGDSQLMFPQDSSLGASAKEIVNCRCVMTPVEQ